MKETLYNLIELQRVDKELNALEAMKGDLPHRVQRLRDELTASEERLQAQKDELGDARKTKLHWEGECQALQEKLKKYQDQLYAVTTNKEYDAITIEIDTIKEKIDEAENLILECIDREERALSEIEEMESRVAALQEDLKVKEKDLTEKIKATEKETASYSQQREQIISMISKPILYQYERIRKGLGNTAVVEISRQCCDGCHATIPPQTAVEVRMMTRLIMCESCGRILVFKGNKNPVTAH